MGKALEVETNVFSVFGSVAWTDRGIKAYPREFDLIEPAENNGMAIRISILLSGNGVNLISTSGVLLIEIFTPTSAGPKIITTISDTLDEFFVGKSISSAAGIVTQFFQSSIGVSQKDAANPRLSVTLYSVNFNHNGVN